MLKIRTRSVHVGSHTKDQLAINQASNFGVCNTTAIALFSPLCLPYSQIRNAIVSSFICPTWQDP